jgi:hypothetical protein
MKKIKEIEGWLNVSIEGFAQQNAARPIEHLVKELVQNSLDSIEPEHGEGEIYLQTITKKDPSSKQDQVWVICTDNGIGINDIENIRTVFWTSKQDSHLKRGRMGRGFKELLCLSKEVKVESLDKIAHFKIDEENKHKLEILESNNKRRGTHVEMLIPSSNDEVSPKLLDYFEKLILPDNCNFSINSKQVKHRTPTHSINGVLTTEAFEEGKWVKPQKKTTIEIFKLLEGEKEGLIFEMGIPICPVEWELPYHVNVLQRVPMNPNRDAVMPGYAAKVHKCCLPTLITELDSEQARASWVAEAALKSQDPHLQRKVLEKAFGGNLARSVPGFGKFDYNADAHEMTGAKILDTKQLSGGFKELAKLHLPTSKEVAKQAHDLAAKAAATNTVDLEKANSEAEKYINLYGKNKIKKICQLHKFLADEILKKIFPVKYPTCTVRTAIMADTAEATWSNESSILTLALDLERIWLTPLDQDNFSLIIHEVAHELAAHHGRSFSDALEQCAGASCVVLIEHRNKVQNLIDNIITCKD